jgi:arsenate reductase
MLRIWHNPRCSKSRAALALLHENGHAPDEFHYLHTPPDHAMLNAVLEKLGIGAGALVRRGQAEWKALDLTPDSPEEDVRAAILAHPILIERPIVETAERAVIGRPPEAVLDIL